MAITFLITSAGYTKIQAALSTGSNVGVTYYQVGSAILVPTRSMTAVSSLVFTSPLLDPSLQISKVDSNTIDFRITMPPTMGPFTVGNVGLFCSDGTMFAIAALDNSEQKYISNPSSNIIGNILTFDLVANISGIGSSVTVTIASTSGVTSVGLTSPIPNIIIVGNSPISSTGNLSITLNNQLQAFGSLNTTGVVQVSTVSPFTLSTFNLGTAATRSVTDVTSGTVASVGNATQFDIPMFTDSAGTLGTTGRNFNDLRLAPVQVGAVTSPLNFYVSTTGNDNTNTGIDPASPYLTIQRAWDALYYFWDVRGTPVTIFIADGTYNAGVVAAGQPIGMGFFGAHAARDPLTPSAILFQGNLTNPRNVVINSPGSCFIATYGSSISLRGMQLQAGGTQFVTQQVAGVCAYASSGGVIDINNVDFFTATAVHMFADTAGEVVVSGSYTVSGGAQVHMLGAGGGAINVETPNPNPVVATINNNPNFSNSFVAATLGGSVNAAQTTWTGAATGVRYVATLGGAINAGGTIGAPNPNFYPGSAPGILETAGSYGTVTGRPIV